MVRDRTGQPRVWRPRRGAQGVGPARAVRSGARASARPPLPRNLVVVAPFEASAEACPARMLVVVGLFGLAIGSFLNVVNGRLPRSEERRVGKEGVSRRW